MSLAADESEGEQIELRSLQTQLETTQKLVSNLTQQLFELREQVTSNRLVCLYRQVSVSNCMKLSSRRPIHRHFGLKLEKFREYCLLYLISSKRFPVFFMRHRVLENYHTHFWFFVSVLWCCEKLNDSICYCFYRSHMLPCVLSAHTSVHLPENTIIKLTVNREIHYFCVFWITNDTQKKKMKK